MVVGEGLYNREKLSDGGFGGTVRELFE